jgi:RNA-binding protein
MRALKGFERTYLRGRAHALKPVVQVGKNGLSPALLESVRQALLVHELIKIKFVEHKEEKKALAADIARETDSELAGMVGNIAILYREHPDPERRVITLPARIAPPPAGS